MAFRYIIKVWESDLPCGGVILSDVEEEKMLDAVNILKSQASVTSPVTRSEAVVASSESAQQKAGNFVTSSIRIDNLQNFAVLEYRNQAGKVVEQYPTQTQIDAFKSAQRLLEKRPEGVAPEPQTAAAPKARKDVAPQYAPSSATTESASPSGTGNTSHSVLV